MSIVIDSDITYLQNKLQICPTKFREDYANSSVEEIIQAEAAQGNQVAISLANEILNNPALIIELFQLADPQNKYMILSEMTSQQLDTFLPEMEKKDMLQGLYFFSQDKLMKLLEDIPPEQLVKTVFQMFSQEEVVQLLPNEQLDKFLTSTEIDKNVILKHLQSIPIEYLQQMLEGITGEEVDITNNFEIAKQIGALNPLQYKDALFSMQPNQKQQLVLSLGKEHEEWFQLFDKEAYTNMINVQKQKPEIVKAMSVIENEEIIKMIAQLPNDLLSIVITQMDTDKFAEILLDRYPEIIAAIMIR